MRWPSGAYSRPLNSAGSLLYRPADLRRFFNVVEIYISLRTGNRNEAARLAMSQFCNVALVETLDGRA